MHEKVMDGSPFPSAHGCELIHMLSFACAFTSVPFRAVFVMTQLCVSPGLKARGTEGKGKM